METIDSCPHCKTKIKDGVWNSVYLLNEQQTKLINEYIDEKQDGYCSKCGEKLIKDATTKRDEEFEMLSGNIKTWLPLIPVVTLQQPFEWDYRVMRMITAQSTMGTGVFTELTSSFTDLVGRQSGSYNEKLKQGENNCLDQMRTQALNIGANAVIGVDIDYSDIGGAKSMVMVCMSGTAIYLKNPQIISEKFEEKMKELIEFNNRIKYLRRL